MSKNTNVKSVYVSDEMENFIDENIDEFSPWVRQKVKEEMVENGDLSTLKRWVVE